VGDCKAGSAGAECRRNQQQHHPKPACEPRTHLGIVWHEASTGRAPGCGLAGTPGGDGRPESWALYKMRPTGLGAALLRVSRLYVQVGRALHLRVARDPGPKLPRTSCPRGPRTAKNRTPACDVNQSPRGIRVSLKWQIVVRRIRCR
jgi:hypothetical protein